MNGVNLPPDTAGEKLRVLFHSASEIVYFTWSNASVSLQVIAAATATAGELGLGLESSAF